MSSEHDLILEDVDADGALLETFDAVSSTTRADLLRGAAVGGGALLAAFAVPGVAQGGRSHANDIAILNYALALEYLQSSFYREALRLKTLRGKLLRQARVVGAHERAHVDALQKALGRAAIKRPFFNFRGTTEDAAAFRKTAVAFEDLGTAAYKGQAPNIQSKGYLAAAIAIHSVEARHAAWIRRLAGVVPAPDAFDEPVTKSEAGRLVASTHFIVRLRANTPPPFTG